MWPKESSRALADVGVFKLLLQAPSGHFFPHMQSLSDLGRGPAAASLLPVCLC